jgi:hypothetical protein
VKKEQRLGQRPDKSGLGTINLIQEIVDWAVAAGLVVGAMFLYTFYVTFAE